MTVRAILLLAIIAALSVGIGHADDAMTLPSRKASVVMPLLRQISPNDSPQNAQDKITKILGKSDMELGSGPRQGRFSDDAYYWLDDKSYIIVSFLNGRFSGFGICLPDHSFVTLYQVPKS